MLGKYEINFLLNPTSRFCIALVFFGTLLNVQNLHGSIYVNFSYFCLVDLLGNSVFFLLVDRVGRRLLYHIFLLLAITSCLATILPALRDGEPGDY